MSALADALRGLMPFAGYPEAPKGSYTTFDAARDVLRKHAPCDVCKGAGQVTTEVCVIESAKHAQRCGACASQGWTPASVEAAIKRQEERERLDKAVLDAAEAWGNTASEGEAEDAALTKLAGALIEKLRLGPK